MLYITTTWPVEGAIGIALIVGLLYIFFAPTKADLWERLEYFCSDRKMANRLICQRQRSRQAKRVPKSSNLEQTQEA